MGGPCPISKGGGQEHPESITGEKPQPRVPRIRLQPNGDKICHGDYEKTDLEEGQRREEYGGWTSARRGGAIERKSKHPVARVYRSHGRRLGYQRILTAYLCTTDDEVVKIQLMRVDETVRRRVAPSPLLI